MIIEHDSGTLTATVGTEHVLGTADDATDGVYQLVVDVSALQAGDRVEFALREKATSSGTKRRTVIGAALGPATDTLYVSDSFLLLHGWDFTLTQTAGTGRSFPWSIRRVS
jgi:hypothetical protein